MVDASTLAAACRAAVTTAGRALDWIRDDGNEEIVGRDRAFLERSIRQQAYRAGRLARSADRPMSIGVFGPSQAGKSYLVSVFARKGDALVALFDDPGQPEVDFIQKINPYGEKEATGLVTRFSIERPKTPAGFPVALRLLTQTDLVKILANTYYLDGDQEAEVHPTSEEVEAHVAAHEGRMRKDFTDVLRGEDVWDVEEYFHQQLRRPEARVFQPFWDRMAWAAPRLSLGDRVSLFSILWGRHEPLSTLLLELFEALSAIDFAEEAFCPLSALVPAEAGILSVETLMGLGEANAERVKVKAGSREVDLPRPVLTALAAELRIAIKEKPWPLFEHTDILDFPGYRGRDIVRLEHALKTARAATLKELVLRGKVDYLFQRYTAEQELTGMMLCLKPSNMDIPSLPLVVDQWVSATHGATPEARSGRPVFLFFVFTMFDMHLTEKAGDADADPGLRFQARLEASLLKPFGRLPDSWPKQWTPNEPFRNCFWLRNPNFKAEGIIEYDGMREVAIRSDKSARIAELREGYLRVADVQRHFRDPALAFDEALRLNDGGVTHLAEALAEVCRSGMKQTQVTNRLADLKQRIAEQLAPFYVSTNSEKRVEERIAAARAVVADFEECDARQKFGTLLRGFCIDRDRLLDAFRAIGGNGGDARETTKVSGADVEPRVAGRTGRWSEIIDGAKHGTSASTAPSASPRRNGRATSMARAAVQAWSRSMHEACEDERFAQAVGIPSKSLSEVMTELSTAAHRNGLEQAIVVRLHDLVHIETIDQSAAKAVIVAERLINGFVTSMGTVAADPPPVFDTRGIGAEPAPFQRDFVDRWVTNFWEQVPRNAQSADGLVHDPEQNARLGTILADLGASSR